MSSRRLLWPAVLVAAAAFACAEPQGDASGGMESGDAAMATQAADMQAAQQAASQMESAYVTAFNAGDGAGIAALFAEDGTQAPPGEPVRDRAAIEAAYTELLAAGTMTLTVEREDMIVGDGRIASWGGFTVTVTTPDAEPQSYSGRYGTVSRQEPDGSWKIIRHLYNYETLPPAM